MADLCQFHEQIKETGECPRCIENQQRTEHAWLRDEFAKAALTGLAHSYEVALNRRTPEWIATAAYALADAMLAEREKGAK